MQIRNKKWQGSVFGYEMERGSLTMKFPGLHEGSIISMAYLPEQEVLITSTVDSGGTVSADPGGTCSWNLGEVFITSTVDRGEWR